MTSRKVQRIRRKEWKVHIIIGGFGRQVAATRCSHSSLRQIVSCEKFGLRNRSLSPQQVAQNQIRLHLCDLWRRWNSDVETKISKKIVQYTRGDLSLRRVAQLSAGTYRPTCTHGMICRRELLQWHVAWCVPTLTKTRRGENRSSAETKYLGV